MFKRIEAVLLVVMLLVFGNLFAQEKINVVVMNLTSKSVSSAITGNITDMIRDELVNSGKYTVLDKAGVDKILKQKSEQLTYCAMTVCAVEIGKTLNVPRVVVGSVLKTGGKYTINVRMVDVKSEKMTVNVTENCASEKQFAGACKTAVKKLVEGKSEPDVKDAGKQAEVKKAKTPDQEYNELIEKARRGHKTIDFKNLRMLYTKTTYYNPYEKDPNSDKMYGYYEKKEYDKAIKTAKLVMEKNYLDMDAHFISMVCSKNLQRMDDYDYHNYVFKRMISSVLETGEDGKTPETAYTVINVREEYLIFNVLGMDVKKQSVVKVGDRIYDKMELINDEKKEEITLFFNVDIPLAWLVKHPKGSDKKKEPFKIK